jgi:hypothetical protein
MVTLLHKPSRLQQCHGYSKQMGNRQILENQTRPNLRNKNRQIAEPRSQILEYQKIDFSNIIRTPYGKR